MFQYLPYLAAAGVKPTVLSVVPDQLLRARYAGGRAYRVVYHLTVLWRTVQIVLSCLACAGRFDAIVIQRVILPPPLAKLLGRIRRKVVFDFDDAIYLTDGLEQGMFSRLQGWLRRGAVAHTLSNVGHAIVENCYNRSYATRYCPGASIITGPIDTERYTPGAGASGDEVVLGWVGKQSTESYLNLIRPALSEIGKRHPNVRLLLIGAEKSTIPGLRVERRAWTLESELQDLWQFDIGLMPLPDDAWTRGKGGYKLLQYMALGIPAVASPVGVNSEIVADGESGFLARSQDDWVDCLSRLICDEALRGRMGSVGRLRAEQRYSLRESSTRLLEILRELARGGRRCRA